jgi:hypothetical protein
MLYWENMKNEMVPYHGRQRTEFFSSNVNIPLHWIHIYNSENWCVRSGYLCQGVHRWWSEETFNSIRNKRSSNHIVTKTNPMELNKRHRHSNSSTAIPAMLCYIPWIRNVTCQCLFLRVVYFNMKFRLYG